MAIGRIPEPGTGIPESIVDAKGDIVTATAADTPARLAVGTNDYRLVAASGEATGLKYVADTQNTVADAKGDLLVGTGADTIARLAVGTNGHTLVADSAETTGLKWAAASSAMTLVSSGSFTAASSFNLGTPFTSSYRNYKVLVSLVNTAVNNNPGIYCYPRASGSNNSAGGVDTFHCQWDGTPDYLRSKQTNQNYIQIGNFLDDGWVMDMTIYQPNIAAKTFARMKGICSQQGSGTDNGHYDSNFTVQNTTQWDSLGFTLSGDTFTGFYRVYGLAD